jgi:hypothetical protein
MKIHTILSQSDLGSMALPEFQRGYVWNRDQVRDLVLSLYRKHPVGSLLTWATRAEDADTRGDGAIAPPGVVKLLLDGQQRITSLYGIIREEPGAEEPPTAQPAGEGLEMPGRSRRSPAMDFARVGEEVQSADGHEAAGVRLSRRPELGTGPAQWGSPTRINAAQ